MFKKLVLRTAWWCSDAFRTCRPFCVEFAYSAQRHTSFSHSLKTLRLDELATLIAHGCDYKFVCVFVLQLTGDLPRVYPAMHPDSARIGSSFFCDLQQLNCIDNG